MGVERTIFPNLEFPCGIHGEDDENGLKTITYWAKNQQVNC